MKTKLNILAALTLAFRLLPSAFAQGTAFTYQGRLNDGPGPATGTYEFCFTLYDSPSGGTQQGGVVTNSPTLVSNGLFTVTLDFGNQFPGAGRWLEIGVRTNGAAAFITLTPRQALTPTPYAITAATVTGVLPNGSFFGVYSNVVILNNPANQFSGVYGGDGIGLTNVNASALGGLAAGSFWQTGGNLGTTAGANFLGTADDQPLIVRVNGQEAFRFEPTPDTPNVVGGYSGNYVQPGLPGVTIGGGGTAAFGDQPNIVTNNGNYATIAGGYHNTVTNYGGAILGGSVNFAGGLFATIGGGQLQTALGDYSVTAGGYNNTIETNAVTSVIAGGHDNLIQSASFSIIGSGGYNVIQPNAYDSAIGGGGYNTIQTDAHSSFIGGGGVNTIATNSPYSTIGGGYYNTIQPNVSFATIGGGINNVVQTNADMAMIAGGHDNTVQSAPYAIIGGGGYNVIQLNAYDSVIGGGGYNTIQTNAHSSFIGGGGGNSIQADAPDSTIGGGYNNTIQPNDFYSTIGGGGGNTIQTNASYSTIGGGVLNTIQTNAQSSTIGGGYYNTVQSNAYYATIPGGYGNVAAGNYSFAAGQQAQALHQGSFVWADSQNAGFASSSSDQFLIRAAGGIGINTNAPQSALHVNGTVTATAFVGGGGSLSGLNASQLTGAVPGSALSGAYPSAVNFNNPSNSFTGNGGGVTNVNALTLEGVGANGFWRSTGNAGTSPGVNFIGTTDNAKLLVRGSFVGINRVTQISPQEYFGFDAPAAPGDFGGMYINTTNSTSLPFYGYALNGGVYAYHFVDGVDGFKWKLAFGGVPVPPITAVPGNPFSSIGLGTTTPQGALHIYSADNPTVVRVQSTGTPGFGRIEFVSNPQGDVNEWRPGYIQSTDNGGFTGGLAFHVNGTGAANKFGDTEVMRIVNGTVGINTNNPQGALHVNGEIHWGAANILSVNQSGSIELGNSLQPGATPFIDFHLGGGSLQDYNVRIINSYNEALEIYRLSSSTPMARFTSAGLTVNGTFVSVSDRNAKENFRKISPLEVLDRVAALPISRWNYKEDITTEHIGPMAQDFYAAFKVGPDDKHIATVDEGGVALAAIQGLNEKVESGKRQADTRIEKLEQTVEQKQTEITELKRQNQSLAERLEKLERLLEKQITAR